MRKIFLLLSSGLLGLMVHAQESSDFNFTEFNTQSSIVQYLIENSDCELYSCEVFNELKTLYDDALLVKESAESQTEIDNQVQLMENAINDYAAAGATSSGSLNTTELSVTITIATWLLSSTETGSGIGQYPNEDYNNFYNAKQDAKAALSEATSQTEINNQLQLLKQAIETFKATVITKLPEENLPETLDVSVLEKVIDDAELLLQHTTYGTEVGQYPVVEYFKLYQATTAAKFALKTVETETDVENQATILTPFVENYGNTVLKTAGKPTITSTLNVSSLSAKIDMAQYLLDSTSHGYKIGQYAVDEYVELCQMVSTARTAITNASTQSDIDKLVPDMEEAIENYFDAINTENITPDPKENMFDIFAIANNGNFGELYGEGSYYKNQQITLIAIPKSGFHFEKWNDGNTENPRQITVSRKDIFVANFAENTEEITDSTLFSVTAVPANEEFGVVLGSSKNIGAGTKITLTAAVTYDGYKFSHWNDGNTENPRQITVNEDLILIAFFENGSSSIDEFDNNLTIQILNQQIIVDGEAPEFVYDIQGRKIINQNLKAGIYFIVNNTIAISALVK